MDTIIWKPISGYEEYYEINCIGDIRRFPTGTRKKSIIMKTHLDRYGYIKAALSINYNRRFYTVHRLVAFTFIPNPDNKTQINHKNGVKTDNRIENLEWCTVSENNSHKFKVLNHIANCSKYVDQLDLNGVFIKRWRSIGKAAKELGLRRECIRDTAKGFQNTSGGFKWKYAE